MHGYAAFLCNAIICSQSYLPPYLNYLNGRPDVNLRALCSRPGLCPSKYTAQWLGHAADKLIVPCLGRLHFPQQNKGRDRRALHRLFLQGISDCRERSRCRPAEVATTLFPTTWHVPSGLVGRKSGENFPRGSSCSDGPQV